MTFYYSISNPFPQLLNLQGRGLNDGEIYIGVAGQDPVANPINVYWASNGTDQASQPLQVQGGFVVRSGTPATAYIASNYSMKAFDAQGSLLYYLPNVLDPVFELSELFDDLSTDAGAGMIGFSQDETYAQGTVGNHLKRFICLTDAPYNGLGNGVFNNATAFTDALADIDAAGGGTLWVPEGNFYKTGNHILPPNTILAGAGFRATTITQNSAHIAFTWQVGCVIRDLALSSTGTATGAVNCVNGNSGFQKMENVEIANFTAAGAIALTVDDSFRTLLSHCYFFTNYTHIKFLGDVTSFEAYKVNFSTNNGSGKCLWMPAGESQIDAVFRRCYFESLLGTNPIYFGTYGPVTFEDCGAEDYCVNSGHSGTVTDPIFIRADNPASLTVKRFRFGGFNSAAQTYSGTAYQIYGGADIPKLVIDDCFWVQTGADTGFTPRLVFQQGRETVFSLTNNEITGAGWTASINAERALTGGISLGFPANNFTSFSNVMYKTGSSTARHSRWAPVYTSTTTEATSGTTLKTFDTKTFAARSFAEGQTLHIVASGTRAGTADVKQLTLTLTAGATTANYDLGGAITTATSWFADIYIKFNSSAGESLTANVCQTGENGFVLTDSTLAYDTAANDFVVALKGQCSNAGDVMTRINCIMERM